jgi:hypothetical protein
MFSDAAASVSRPRTMKSNFTKLARRLVPSTAMLSYNRVFKLVGNGLTRLPDLVFPEFRQLPPNHLRVRVGVGNRLFNNQAIDLDKESIAWNRKRFGAPKFRFALSPQRSQTDLTLDSGFSDVRIIRGEGQSGLFAATS